MKGLPLLSVFVFAFVIISNLSIAAPAGAKPFRITIYDDGKSCPGNCDAHVVLNAKDNGTAHAFLTSSSRSKPAPCLSGKPCRICFDKASTSCMTATYRGSGPDQGTFDFTPAFFAQNCDTSNTPPQLARYCKEMEASIARNGYDKRVNCIKHPRHRQCRSVMRQARKAKRRDSKIRNLCISQGEAIFNQNQSGDQTRRIYGCNYSLLSLGGNGKGKVWKKLQPGACRKDTYVGARGLDCCSEDPRLAAHLHGECEAFYPMPK